MYLRCSMWRLHWPSRYCYSAHLSSCQTYCVSVWEVLHKAIQVSVGKFFVWYNQRQASPCEMFTRKSQGKKKVHQLSLMFTVFGWSKCNSECEDFFKYSRTSVYCYLLFLHSYRHQCQKNLQKSRSHFLLIDTLIIFFLFFINHPVIFFSFLTKPLLFTC